MSLHGSEEDEDDHGDDDDDDDDDGSSVEDPGSAPFSPFSARTSRAFDEVHAHPSQHRVSGAHSTVKSRLW